MNPPLTRNGALTFGLLGLAAGAVIGYFVGQAVARDPQALRATAGRLARGAARGVEEATLAAARTREHLADLWAEAREEARAEVDEREFERAAAVAEAGAGTAAEPMTPERARSRRPTTPSPSAEGAKGRARKRRTTSPAAGAEERRAVPDRAGD